MSKTNKPSHNPPPIPPAPTTSLERCMALDLDYTRVRAALDLDAIAAAQAPVERIADPTPPPTPAMPLTGSTAGCRRWARAPMAACMLLICLMLVGLVAGGGWLVANVRNGSIRLDDLPPLIPWDQPEPSDGSDSDASYEDAAETDRDESPWYNSTEATDGEISIPPLDSPAPQPDSDAEGDIPGQPVEEPETDVPGYQDPEYEAPAPDDTAPFGASVTLDGVTYYDTGYAIPLGVLKDRLRELGAVSDEHVCYAVVGLDSGRYIVATAQEHCYLYKTADAPDPAVWLEAWLNSLNP